MKKILLITSILVALTGAFLAGRFSLAAECQLKSKPMVVSLSHPELIDSIKFTDASGNGAEVIIWHLHGDRVFNIQGNDGAWDCTVIQKDGRGFGPLRLHLYDGKPTHLTVTPNPSQSDDISMSKFVWLKIRSGSIWGL